MKRNFKYRLVSALLIFCFGFSMTPYGFANKTEERKHREYEEALALMQVIGVLVPEIEYDPSSFVSRQDLALYTAKLLGAEEAEVESRYFIDVPAAGYATWAINYLTESGIFSTNEEKLFYPKENADINQVCKVLTSV